LVVITIIAILAGMLLPALSKPKGKTKTKGCLNNYKQLQLAWLMYVDDCQERLPLNEYRDAEAFEDGNPSRAPGWWGTPGRIRMPAESGKAVSRVTLPVKAWTSARPIDRPSAICAGCRVLEASR